MPEVTAVSYIYEFGGLRVTRSAESASPLTQRHATVAAVYLLFGILLLGSGCATPKAGMGSSIDFIGDDGREGNLGGLAGKVVIVDVCASWATACNLNAKVLDEVQSVLGERAIVVTVLLDDGPMGREALRSYRETLGVAHAVALAGPRVRAGTSALGETGGVPRVVVLDKRGVVRIDDSGGVVSVPGLVERVKPLVDEK